MNSFQGKALTWHYLGLLGSAGSTSFTYDTSGRRLSKTTGGTTTNYYYAGDMLVGQKTGNNELEFMFDSSGDYFGFTYNGTAYYYIKNLQGDVISIFNANGNEVATYTYDAWGRTLATTDTSGVNIGAINPIRYRGYYYDTETGFYFLQTRYYVPEICRFLSADGAISEVGGEVLGYNQFAYCFNNPVNMDDSTGNWPQWIKNTVKWVAKNVIKPVVKKIQETVGTIGNVTGVLGYNASAAIGVDVSLSVGVTSDTKGNVGVIFTGCAGGGTPSAAFSAFGTINSSPDIFSQRGPSTQVGGSFDYSGVNVGGEYSFFQNYETNEIYQGLSIFGGIGVPIPIELHGERGYSFVFGINIYDIAEKIYIKIMDW